MDITINLNQSLYARGFNDNERIHHNAFSRAEKLIDAQVKDAEQFDDGYLTDNSTQDFVRYYNTISILGERGAGKTSFLMSLKHDYLYQSNTTNENDKGKDIQLLPIIDPTLFEEKGHLFLLIITLIDDLVNDKRKENDLDDIQKASINRYDEVKAELAQGLPTIQSVNLTYTEPQWHEDEYMMERGMESVRSAFYLEKHFHKLVNEALKILEKKVFMLMLDDIDVDFRRGWMVLETLRKFLTTKQMIVILSGNMKLYSKNVRKQQWKNFGESLLINERDDSKDGKSEYTRLVNEIEGQYMQKVLKSENRVFLYSMQENMLLNGDKYIVSYGENPNGKDLIETYRSIFENNGVKDQTTQNVFISFLLTTSVRTQIHFLKTALEVDNNILSKISAFASRIYAQGVDIEIATSDERFNIVLLRYLVSKRIIEEAYQLTPTFNDTDINSVLTGFSFVFSQLYKNSRTLVFDYWVRICYTRNCMHYLSYEDKAEIKSSVTDFMAGAGIYQSRDLQSIIGNAMSFMLAQSKNIDSAGTFPLLGFSSRARGKGRNLETRFDKVIEGGSNLQKILAYLPFVSLLQSNNERSLYYSLYILMAKIGQISKSDGLESIKEAIKTACTPVSYQVRNEESTSLQTGASEIEMELDFDNAALTQLSNAVKSWLEAYAGDKAYAAYLFGRISTRFYFASSNISAINREKGHGTVFSLFVAGFLNACIIEEMRVCYGSEMSVININNVSSSYKVLSDNLGKISDKSLPFTRWMAGCPILYPFLDPDAGKTIFDFIKSCCPENNFYDEFIMTEAGSLTVLLDKVDANIEPLDKNTEPLPKFISHDKATTKAIIDVINANGDLSDEQLRIIVNGDKSQAKELLGSMFVRVQDRSLRAFRKRIDIVDGKLNLKQ